MRHYAIGAMAAVLAVASLAPQSAESCTRVIYEGLDSQLLLSAKP